MSSELLFGACWALRLNQLSAGEWEKFRSLSEQNTDHTVSVTFQFCLMALRALDNSLILNLYWEVLRFLKFPYLTEDETWNIFRQRPQLCYTLVCSVIRDIEKGIYAKRSFLPSLPKMAKHYKVSVSTVRRSLSILNNAGLTKSFQGKGTQDLPEVVQADIGLP